ncbi:DUF3592 domain-containing protein [Motilimonas eburnea]|uniref:DUF3592 domain-containing protein n=1 Tax=Motilimonas eburnea TaxID=1737488 RepID=UPI001E50B66B|nr:DUF3592 domain-containing protein [Motilimonas eburnea]MCE2573436.1 DUF3592 domain-containing protein [Motilimonas eburnea]
MKYQLLIKIATGRSIYSTYFLLIFMFIAPAAVFTSHQVLDVIAWIMLITLGVFIFITGVVTFQEAIASKNWPSSQAYNVKYSLKCTSNKGAKSYIPAIKCNFTVDGTEYSGTEYDFSASYTSKVKADAKLDSVKSRSSVLIYYKPSDPSINVINPGLNATPFIRIVLGVLMIIVPILIWSKFIILK